jgi:hypothetical protein
MGSSILLITDYNARKPRYITCANVTYNPPHITLGIRVEYHYISYKSTLIISLIISLLLLDIKYLLYDVSVTLFYFRIIYYKALFLNPLLIIYTSSQRLNYNISITDLAIY